MSYCIIDNKTLVVVKDCVVVEVLIAFKVPPRSGFVDYVTSMALSLSSWLYSLFSKIFLLKLKLRKD